jgi:hypothetical protein
MGWQVWLYPPGPIGPKMTHISPSPQVTLEPHGVPAGGQPLQQLAPDATVPPIAVQRSADRLILQLLSITQSESVEHG